jgi:hypothetical protein
MPNEKYFKALDKVLKDRFSVRYYSLEGYQEEATCLKEVDGEWIVFQGERGNHYNEETCNTPLLACLTMLRHLTHKTNELREMEEEFLNILASMD